ncbi:MAG: hypothetical protein N3A66_02395, partial [Planctomycetota bacterium]|nr:hypothetical protein [Planctomycetota bacterium]
CIICVNAAKGVELGTRRAWDYAGQIGVSRLLAVTRMDGEHVHYSEVLKSITKAFGNRCVPFVVPKGEGPTFAGAVSVFAEGAGAEAEALRQQIIEFALETDDALMEKYLEGG